MRAVRTRLGALTCALTLAACAGSTPTAQVAPKTTQTPVAIRTPTSAPASGAGQRRPVNATEYAAVEKLMRRAEHIRGLHFKRPVEVHVENADAIRAYIRAELEREQLETARLMYVALGLLPSDLDVEDLLVRLMGEQVIGYYDAREKRLVVRDDVVQGFSEAQSFPGAEEVLLHELVHALQDQHFDLGATMEVDRTTDGANAFRALVEGDATLAMVGLSLEREHMPLSDITQDAVRIAFLRQMAERSATESPELSRAPAIVRIPMLSAYADGVVYAAHLHGQGGWDAINAAHRSPPESTEAILHPETAGTPSAPLVLQTEGRLAQHGLQRVESDSLGELELGVYFGRGSHDAAAKRAAAGWDGDVLELYRGDAGELSVLWLTRWDSIADAKEAATAAKAVLTREPEQVRQGCTVVRAGRRVLMVRGFAPDALTAVSAWALASHAPR